MGRTPGAKNKKTVILKKKNIFLRLFSRKALLTNEDIFIKEISEAYIRWKAEGEKEYSDVYKMLINKFTSNYE